MRAELVIRFGEGHGTAPRQHVTCIVDRLPSLSCLGSSQNVREPLSFDSWGRMFLKL